MDIQEYINSFLNDGIVEFKGLLDEDSCKSLYKKIQKDRPISKSIFLQEDEFKKILNLQKLILLQINRILH